MCVLYIYWVSSFLLSNAHQNIFSFLKFQFPADRYISWASLPPDRVGEKKTTFNLFGHENEFFLSLSDSLISVLRYTKSAYQIRNYLFRKLGLVFFTDQIGKTNLA